MAGRQNGGIQGAEKLGIGRVKAVTGVLAFGVCGAV